MSTHQAKPALSCCCVAFGDCYFCHPDLCCFQRILSEEMCLLRGFLLGFYDFWLIGNDLGSRRDFALFCLPLLVSAN